MRNAVVLVDRHCHDLLHGVFLALADSLRNLSRFADAHAHVAIAVAYDHQRGKSHGAAALDGLGYALDGNYFIV